MTEPPGTTPSSGSEPPFDPYRFGHPDQPPDPAYAPPGYRPPPDQSPAPPAFGSPPSPYASPPAPYGQQPPYGPPPAYGPPGQQFGAPGQQFGPPGQPPYGAPGYPPPPYGQQYLAPTGAGGNGKAIAGLVLGILALALFFLNILDIPLIVLGIVFGALGISAARRTGRGRGMAMAGLICALIAAVAATVFFVFAVHRTQGCADKYDKGSVQYNNCILHGD